MPGPKAIVFTMLFTLFFVQGMYWSVHALPYQYFNLVYKIQLFCVNSAIVVALSIKSAHAAADYLFSLRDRKKA